MYLLQTALWGISVNIYIPCINSNIVFHILLNLNPLCRLALCKLAHKSSMFFGMNLLIPINNINQ